MEGTPKDKRAQTNIFGQRLTAFLASYFERVTFSCFSNVLVSYNYFCARSDNRHRAAAVAVAAAVVIVSTMWPNYLADTHNEPSH